VRVSVVIPTFNRARLVTEAVSSVIDQLDDGDECLVVDDGSTDETAARIATRFAGRVRLVTTANRGVAAARNRGVQESRGELIAFLDSDDVWLPGKLVAQRRFLAQDRRAEICQTNEIWVRNGRRVNPCLHHRKPSGWIFHESLERCLVGASTVLLRRSLFERCGGFDEALPVCEDYDLWLRISRDTPIWLIDEPLVIKRGGHSDQLSHRFWGMDRFRVAALAKLLAAGALGPAQRGAVARVLRERCAILAAGALKRGQLDAALRYQDLARHWKGDSTIDYAGNLAAAS